MIDFWQMLYSLVDLEFFLGALVAALIIYFVIPKAIRKDVKLPVFGLLSSGVIAYILSAFLKLLFRIPRPCAGQLGCPSDYSFPSDHATIMFSIAIFLILYKRDWKFSLTFLILAILVSFSRVLVGIHAIQDVIAGAVLGTVIGYLVYIKRSKILDLIKFI